MPLQTHIRSPLSLVGCTNIPLASGEGSGERNHSLFRLLEPGQISVRSPGSAGADRAPEDWGALMLRQPLSRLLPVRSRRSHISRRRSAALGQGNDQDLPDSAAIELDPLMEPLCQYRTRLMSHPQPGKLDHRCSQPRVPGFGDALFVSDGPALPRRRRQPA